MSNTDHTLWSFAREQGFTYQSNDCNQARVAIPLTHAKLGFIMEGLERLFDHTVAQRYQEQDDMVVILNNTPKGVPYGN